MRPAYRAAICHRDCVRFAQRSATPPAGVLTMPIRAFTIPIRVFTMRRSWRSRRSDPRVHDRPKSAAPTHHYSVRRDLDEKAQGRGSAATLDESDVAIVDCRTCRRLTQGSHARARAASRQGLAAFRSGLDMRSRGKLTRDLLAPERASDTRGVTLRR